MNSENSSEQVQTNQNGTDTGQAPGRQGILPPQPASMSSFGVTNFRTSSQRQSGVNTRNVDPKSLFVGLCNVNENHSMEDTHKSQNSIMINLLDSTIWNNGNQIFYGGTKNIKIKSPFAYQKQEGDEEQVTESDTIRVAVDMRFASNFQTFWNEEEQNLVDEEVQMENENGGNGNNRLFQNQMRGRSRMSQRRNGQERSNNLSHRNA